MTNTKTSLSRAAIGLILAGALAGCAPSEIGREPDEGTPSAASSSATGEARETGEIRETTEESRRELPNSGDMTIDAQWQSLGQGEGSGNEGGNGTPGNGGGGGDIGGNGGDIDSVDPCRNSLNRCTYVHRVDVSIVMGALETPRSVKLGTVGISTGQTDAFRVVENTCTGLEVSDGTGTCSITVELSPQQPGLYEAKLMIDVPSHQVTETVDLERLVTGTATALPTDSTEPAEEATTSTGPPESVSPEPSVPGTTDPPVPPDATSGGTAGPIVNPPDPVGPAPDLPVEPS